MSEWNAEKYIEHASFVAQHGRPVVELLNPRIGEKILDLGCGDGALTLKLKELGVEVHGVDLSLSMVEATKARGLSAEVMAGEQLNFDSQFDAVFSNAALHWMKTPEAVVAGVNKALVPGGRFVGELGGQGNIQVLVGAMEAVFRNHPEFGGFVNPWYFPSQWEYTRALESGGFKVSAMELIPRPTHLETGAKEWLKLFATGITATLSDKQRALCFDEIEDLVRPALFSDKGWVADYVRLRFSAIKL